MANTPYIIVLDAEEFKIVQEELHFALAAKTASPRILERILKKLHLTDKVQLLMEELAYASCEAERR